MAPAASTTDVCPYRAAHSALAVRLVQVTPAANPREPGQWHRTATTRARPQRAARAERLIRQVLAVRWEGACSREAHARAHSSLTRAVHARAHRRTKRRAQTHTRTRAHTRASADTRAHESTSTRFLPRDTHVTASAAALIWPATEGERHGRWSEMRAWVGLVRTHSVSLDCPSSTP